MASFTFHPPTQMLSINRKALLAQPLPYVCKRCLALLAKDQNSDVPAQSLNTNSETTSESNQPSSSIIQPSDVRSRNKLLKSQAALSSTPRGRKRVFTKKYPDKKSPRSVRVDRASKSFSKKIPLGISKCKKSTLEAPEKDTSIISLKEVASACAIEVVRKLQYGELKTAKKSKTSKTKANIKSPTKKRRGRKPKSTTPKQSAAKLPENTPDGSSTVNPPYEGLSGLIKPDGMINTSGTDLSAICTEGENVPRLAYGLDRVLFNPGVYYLKDPRSRIYNFDPYLEKIMPVSEFDFSLLKDYITSSQDEVLTSVAKKQNLKYMGSSSSMTGLLSHFHFLLSSWRSINVSMLSKDFPVVSTKFTRWCKSPSAVFLRYKDGAYAIDSDNTFQASNVLTYLGKSMEKLLTLNPDKYERYRKTNDNPVTHSEREKPEMYNYSSLGDILMRSQLDAYDPRLPGSGLFDLKSRAVISIRMEVNNHERGLGYEIKREQGQWESFEREYHDMIRATLLKYALQVRMGRMDGIFVAYHNVERIFGFQYISLDEMDFALHGQQNTNLGNQEFELSLKLLNEVLNRIVQRFPEQSCSLLFEANESSSSLNIFAVPIHDAEIETSIKKAGDRIEEVEKIVRNSTESLSEASAEDMSEESFPEVASNFGENSDSLEEKERKDEIGFPLRSVSSSSRDNMSSADHNLATDAKELFPDPVNESSVDNVEKGYESSSENFSQLLENHQESAGLLGENVPEDGKHAANETPKTQAERSPCKNDIVEADKKIPLFLRLHIANKVNGEYVKRPEMLGNNDKWDLEYRIDEIKEESKALKSYNGCLNQKKKLLEQTRDEEKRNSSSYHGIIRRLSDKGRHWRQGQDAVDEAVGQVIYKPHIPKSSAI